MTETPATEQEVVWTVWLDQTRDRSTWRLTRKAGQHVVMSREDGPESAMAFVPGAEWVQTSDTSWRAVTVGGPAAKVIPTPYVTAAMLLMGGTH